MRADMHRKCVLILVLIVLFNYATTILFAQSPPDVTPPLITDVSADSITDSSVEISWHTDEASDTQVEYGLDSGYGNESPLDTSLVTSHNVALTGLQANTTYHYRVRSKNVAGNVAVGEDQTFVTTATVALAFTDITISAGTGGPTEGGHAVIFSDVDVDDRPDLYITMRFDNPMADLFFCNTGGNIFAEESVRRGIDDFDGGSHGACFADLDNDGDFDLYNGTTDSVAGLSPAINNIFRNDGSGYFTDVTALSGIPVREWPTRAVLAFDMEGDGDLDLFCVTNYQGSEDPADERNEVYRNDGHMQFTAINSGALYTAPAGQGATAIDYDADGDIDVIAVNRTGPVNILGNDGQGNFTLILPSSIGITHQGRDGITMADVDNDGDLDMLLVGDPNGYLYLNNGNGTFTFKRSFSSTEGYMGGFADLDNDGDLDLVFAGDDICYLNDGLGNFTEGPTVPVSGIDDPRAIGFADIDNDGDLDFAIGCKHSRNWLVRNNFNSGNWLKVRLISPQGQAGAFGAKTRIYPSGKAGGTLLGMSESRSNNGYLGQDDPVLHFGLGEHTSVDVVVTFLDGSTATRANVAAGQTITINGTDGPQRFHLTVNNGSGDGNCPAGAVVDIFADPPPANQVFDQWTGDTESIADTSSDATTLIMPAANVIVNATYKPAGGLLDRTGTQWAPLIEWSLENPAFTGNPYDLIATVTFVHTVSGETRTTGMFYDGGNTWKFRFTGTQTGVWTFTTSSSDPDLDGYSGTVTINSNPDSTVVGFVTNFGSKWGRLGIDKVFVPQFVMYDNPSAYYNNPGKIDADIQTFMVEHGFTGFHTVICCRWFDINQDRSDNISVPNPDPRTFEALELLITKVYAAGGVVHIWAWGDEERRQTPIRWGKNGTEDQRLQRYIAARLGPLPGWTMGYGFDLDEGVVEEDLHLWHDYMHQHFGWSHFLGARDPGPNADDEPFNQIYEGLDYSSYEQHNPDYNRYVETIEARPNKPSFSADRFRMRGLYPKDYTMEETRRGLWHSTMAGGVANIWGNLLSGSDSMSDPYSNPEWIKTYAEFFKERFLKDIVRDNSITDGVCLKCPSNAHYLFYKENTSLIQIDLSGMVGSQQAITVDAKLAYVEINLDTLSATNQTWTAPYESDWAVAVGNFDIVHRISGKVDLYREGLSNTRMILSEDKSDTLFTGEDGVYSFNGLPFGNYTITPQKMGFAFKPPERNCALLDSDCVNQNFTAIDTLAPQAVLISPNGGEKYLAGQQDTIRWIATDNVAVSWVCFYFSCDGGLNWKAISGQEPDDSSFQWCIPDTISSSCRIKVVAYDRAGNFGLDISDSDFSISSVAVKERTTTAVPKFFFISQNYPNPFNAGTSIQYQLPQARRVTLKIFNFLGQRVMTLGDEFQSPGYYTAYWDGKDEDGNSVSSGVYIYQLVVDGVKTVRRKMMLLK